MEKSVNVERIVNNMFWGFLCLLVVLTGLVHAAVPFSAANSINSAINGAPAVGVADINKDGLPDIVAFSGGCGGMTKMYSWFEAPNWTKHDLFGSTSFNRFVGDLAIADINKDGYPDVVVGIDSWYPGAGTYADAKLYWFQNPGGNATGTWGIHTVYTYPKSTYHIEVEVADMDNDGKLDIVTRDLQDYTTKSQVAIFFQNSSDSWTAKCYRDRHYREGLWLGDVDRDGKKDIILNGWWMAAPSSPRTGTYTEYTIDKYFYTQSSSSGGLENSTKQNFADMDGDGIKDIIIASAEGNAGGKLAWYKVGTSPRTQSWSAKVIEGSQNYCHQIEARDMDLDGDMDLIGGQCFKRNGVYVWYNNGSGSSFSRQTVTTATGIYMGVTGDIDADGDWDIVGADDWSSNDGKKGVYLHRNLLNPSGTPTKYTLTVNSGSGDGSYTAGTVVTITADAAPAGKEFDAWTGAAVADANASTTTITMPANAVTVTATYKDVVDPDPTPDPGTNIALGKAATASSIEKTAHAAGYAVDGIGTTRWASGKTDNEWLQVDLGQTYTLGSVKLVWEAAYGKDYRIDVSTNGSSWSTAYTRTGGTGGTDNLTLSSSPSARYVRMQGIKRGTAWGYSLWEFEVYGTGGTTPPPPPATYVLTVTSGSGDGSYEAGTVVTITADAAPSGKEFDAWTGATVADPNASTTTITMPANAVTVTATYKDVIVPDPDPDPDPTPDPGTNLALGKTAAASSVEKSGLEAAKAVDGIATSRWSSARTNNEWMQVDLGQSYSIGSVVLDWEAAYGKDYRIDVSYNGSSWTTAYTRTNGTGGEETLTLPSGTAGRYVRMQGITRGTVYGYSLWEFEVYGEEGGTTPPPPATYALNVVNGSGDGSYTAGTVVTITADAAPAGKVFDKWTGSSAIANVNAATTSITMPAANTTVTAAYMDEPVTPPTTPPAGTNLALGKTATASSIQTASYAAAKAVDGNAGSRWSSVYSDNQWIQVDLGQVYDLGYVVLNWETAYGKDYRIEVSSDGSTWSTAYTRTGGTGGEETLVLASGTAGRYVRMQGITRGTRWGYSLFEFEVYPAAAPAGKPGVTADAAAADWQSTVKISVDMRTVSIRMNLGADRTARVELADLSGRTTGSLSLVSGNGDASVYAGAGLRGVNIVKITVGNQTMVRTLMMP